MKYFKLFATKEYSVENIVFFEEVQMYKELNEEKRIERGKSIMENFFQFDSVNEINTSRKYVIEMKNKIKEGEENFSKDFFDSVLLDVIQTNLSDTFQRFKFSELFREMKQNDKKTKYFLFQ